MMVMMVQIWTPQARNAASMSGDTGLISTTNSITIYVRFRKQKLHILCRFKAMLRNKVR
jgi:hypothetical protein